MSFLTAPPPFERQELQGRVYQAVMKLCPEPFRESMGSLVQVGLSQLSDEKLAELEVELQPLEDQLKVGNMDGLMLVAKKFGVDNPGAFSTLF